MVESRLGDTASAPLSQAEIISRDSSLSHNTTTTTTPSLLGSTSDLDSSFAGDDDNDSDPETISLLPSPNIGDPHHSPTSSHPSLPSIEPPRFNSYQEILVFALKGGLRSYLLSLSLRGGVSFLMSLIKVSRGKASLSSSIKATLTTPTIYRFANMIGSFSFLFKLISNSLLRYRNHKRDRWNPFWGGFVAGCSVLFETQENRLVVMQQFGVRSLQALYNGLRSRDLVRFENGDAVLFSIACGSIMYAYTMQPDTIPREYYSWMLNTARVSKEALSISRANNRALEHPLKTPAPTFDSMTSCIHQHGGPNASKALASFTQTYNRTVNPTTHTLPIVPCSVIHPSTLSCWFYNLQLAYKTVVTIAPVYATLNFVPMVLLKTRRLIESPVELIRKGVVDTLVSTGFLTSYIVLYMTGICSVRNLVQWNILKRDWKGYYYLLGVFASGTSILVEKKSRRAELAM
ncbi:hypothetical protein HDU98_009860 [Podochytrium sp. JEL0797]|nr:hypothetical protein HDU98_009860 [Podochytrium sp. JEL0797]